MKGLMRFQIKQRPCPLNSVFSKESCQQAVNKILLESFEFFGMTGVSGYALENINN